MSVDWLGEIFEWLSCADEYAVTDRDEVGRVPFGASVFGRFGLDPTIPYAGVAMRELNREIRAVVGDSWPERPSGPLGQSRVLIASSHDLDYLPISAIGNVRRILKNIAIALILYRDFSLATSVVGAVARGLVRGISPLDCVGGMLRGQTTSGIRSTYNIICRQAHPRDANYRLEDKAVTDVLSQIRAAGMEIGIHGSYTSLEAKGLGFEIEALARAGFVPSGVRQHWLRFSGDNLFEEIAACGLWYDSTVGFSDHAGFRAGACFPYLPYDFRREQAYPFLEIPLVLMDGAVYEQSRRSGASPQAICKRVFDMIECFGWGGVAILWHNAVFEGAQLPLDIGRLYWELKRSTHDWVSCREIVEATRSAFEGAFEMRYNDLEPHRKGLQACC